MLKAEKRWYEHNIYVAKRMIDGKPSFKGLMYYGPLDSIKKSLKSAERHLKCINNKIKILEKKI